MAVPMLFAAEPTISLTATPRYPWNGLVDLVFTIAADDADGGYADPEPGDELIEGRRLKYVRSLGDVQFNTGVVPGSKNTIEMKFEWEDNPSCANECLFCARGSTTSTATFTGFLIGTKWRFDYNSATGGESDAVALQKGTLYVIRDVAGTVSVNGTVVRELSAASFTVGGPLTLFSSYVGSPGTSTDNFMHGKIYYLKIFADDGTTLLHDFVPWEKDGKVGLYDMTSSRFVTASVGSLAGVAKYDTSFVAKDLVGNTNLTLKTLYKLDGKIANAAHEQLFPGIYNWVWDAPMDCSSRWVTYAGCAPTASAVLFSNVQLSDISEFYATHCGTSISDKTHRTKGTWIKADGTGKSVQFSVSDGGYSKSVCIHFEQSGANVVGYVKWARYVSGEGHHEDDFDANSASKQNVATTEVMQGYGLCGLDARVQQSESSVVYDRVVVEGSSAEVSYTYSVKFNANGGSGTMANETFTYGVVKALTANTFTRTGYTFQGWATTSTGAVVYSDKQSVSNLTVTPNATVNLYAVWKAETYTVRYNMGSAKDFGGDPSPSLPDQMFTIGVSQALRKASEYNGYFEFLGWGTSKVVVLFDYPSTSELSKLVKYKNGETVKDLSTTPGAVVNLYAVWVGWPY